MKKSRGEGSERERVCRQTFEATIPPSCLITANHLSARSLSVTWIHWNVINFVCKNGGLVGNTQLLPHAKMLLVPMSFSLVGRLCSGGLSFD